MPGSAGTPRPSIGSADPPDDLAAPGVEERADRVDEGGGLRTTRVRSEKRREPNGALLALLRTEQEATKTIVTKGGCH